MLAWAARNPTITKANAAPNARASERAFMSWLRWWISKTSRRRCCTCCRVRERLPAFSTQALGSGYCAAWSAHLLPVYSIQDRDEDPFRRLVLNVERDKNEARHGPQAAELTGPYSAPA